MPPKSFQLELERESYGLFCAAAPANSIAAEWSKHTIAI